MAKMKVTLTKRFLTKVDRLAAETGTTRTALLGLLFILGLHHFVTTRNSQPTHRRPLKT